MPIIHTNEFWDYVINESDVILDKFAEILTKKVYDFNTKTYDVSKYYQLVPIITINNNTYKILKFPGGLINYITNSFSNIPVEIKDRKYPLYTEEDILATCKEINKLNPSFEIRDYQIEGVQASLNKFRSLIYSSVGSGKTSIMCIVCKILKDQRILIINNRNSILNQIYERLLSFGIDDVSFNPSGEPDYTKRIVIINSAISDSRLNSQNKDYINFLKNEVNTIIYDEAHHTAGITFFEPIFYTDPERLQHIIGYTGSPFRNYENIYKEDEDFRMLGIIGEPVFTYKMKDTIEDGNIAQPYGYFIRFQNKPQFVPPQFKDNYYMQYRANITYNKARNKAGLEMLKFLNRNGIKTLACFNNIKPGQKLLKELKENGVKALFICGDETIYEYVTNKRNTLKLEKRSGNTDDIRKALLTDYNIIICSTVLDEGVDIDIFQAAVLFSAGKTPIAGIQRIGRASRKRKNERNISFVIDFLDLNSHYTFIDHYKKRRQMMIDSGVKILDQVQDFIKLVEEIKEEKEK